MELFLPTSMQKNTTDSPPDDALDRSRRLVAPLLCHFASYLPIFDALFIPTTTTNQVQGNWFRSETAEEFRLRVRRQVQKWQNNKHFCRLPERNKTRRRPAAAFVFPGAPATPAALIPVAMSPSSNLGNAYLPAMGPRGRGLLIGKKVQQ